METVTENVEGLSESGEQGKGDLGLANCTGTGVSLFYGLQNPCFGNSILHAMMLGGRTE